MSIKFDPKNSEVLKIPDGGLKWDPDCPFTLCINLPPGSYPILREVESGEEMEVDDDGWSHAYGVFSSEREGDE